MTTDADQPGPEDTKKGPPFLAGRIYSYATHTSTLGTALVLDHDFARHDPLLFIRADRGVASLRFTAPPPQTVIPLLRRFAPDMSLAAIKRALGYLPGDLVKPL